MNHQIEFLGAGREGVWGVQRVEGPTSLIERDGRVVEVVVEDVDGGATFIPAGQVVGFRAVES